MYTVEELIEALKQCPPDYVVKICMECASEDIESVGVNPEEKTVGIFA